MATKRPRSPDLIPNPFIKKRNLQWALEPPESRGHIPPEEESDEQDDDSSSSADFDFAAREAETEKPPPPTFSTAAVESGSESMTDHAAHFSALLAAHTLKLKRPTLLPVESYRALYEENFGSPRGAHFVIHQHNHPVAGTHYDLRLQINPTSSASWAVMYGLPGDPNSLRLMRNATETRVHCLWNHLIEIASASTGSLLIWDTGTYSILPRRSKHAPSVDPSSPASSARSDDDSSPEQREHHHHRRRRHPHQTEQEKLHAAFRERKIRLRLDGTRLPRPYVVNLRLTKSEDAQGRAKAARSASSSRGRTRQRRGGRGGRGGGKAMRRVVETTSESGFSSAAEEEEEEEEEGTREGLRVAVETKQQDEKGAGRDGVPLPPGRRNQDTVLQSTQPRQIDRNAQPLSEEMRRELEELDESAQVRASNAYPGAENSVGSVHQRKWFLSLDRAACGFARRPPADQGARAQWVGESRSGRDDGRLGFPFYVRGPDVERSVVTGRLAADILRDEGVSGFVKRKGWKPVLN
ncbi:hypothetical protein SODALDRAFT_157049 [Sodiomyces alkalinus F11]|uniref:DNA ligase D 3'-phosphoesterase domain-containing protein n=1 Tax=Sodiomyces alkalinus (strain CBS 110278 / VKM F-3762 / F11) TaxID=1314773 RepID=A0A3N2PYA0_SODAK|nr:hypothetical protein SODALDRAFT_157049 [Sodiomyces alkalinus F11]ROT39325.1 hypothetical protein SODALDRAFT_157049 [Sodiomyces alkalinus F11]